jgi:putative IMPACT (imprinted ancient) family translation regulator
VTHSARLTDRKSVFQGHAASVSSPAEARAVLDALQAVNKIARADHHMYAFACVDSAGQTHYEHDDDGEKPAGLHLAQLLQHMHRDNTMVVVTRWFGGVQIGADRFRHIRAVAREALEAHSAAIAASAATTGNGDQRAGKRRLQKR